MDRPEWLKRAEEEQKTLAGNCKKLRVMLSNADKMAWIDVSDELLMHKQLHAMIEYNSALSLRIQRHGGVTCAE